MFLKGFCSKIHPPVGCSLSTGPLLRLRRRLSAALTRQRTVTWSVKRWRRHSPPPAHQDGEYTCLHVSCKCSRCSDYQVRCRKAGCMSVSTSHLAVDVAVVMLVLILKHSHCRARSVPFFARHWCSSAPPDAQAAHATFTGSPHHVHVMATANALQSGHISTCRCNDRWHVPLLHCAGPHVR